MNLSTRVQPLLPSDKIFLDQYALGAYDAKTLKKNIIRSNTKVRRKEEKDPWAS